MDQQKQPRIKSPEIGGVRAEIDRLKARISSLESQVTRTADAFDNNTTLYQSSFEALEAQTHVAQRVLSVMACGGPLHVVQSPEGVYTIDFSAYFIEYLFCLSFGQWVRDFCGAAAIRTTPDPAPEAAEGVFIFGG